MAERKKIPDEPPTRPTIRPIEGGGFEYAIFRFTFLFANGDTQIVETTRDDSTLREALLAERKMSGDRIVGASDPVFVGWFRIEPR
jgi:hypothetical protein